MKFKFGIESLAAKVEVPKKEVVREYNDIDINMMGVESMTAYAALESDLLLLNTDCGILSNMGTEADGTLGERAKGIAGRVKTGLKNALASLWGWIKKVYNLIVGLFRKNRTAEVTTAEVVVAKLTPEVYRKVHDEFNRAQKANKETSDEEVKKSKEKFTNQFTELARKILRDRNLLNEGVKAPVAKNKIEDDFDEDLVMDVVEAKLPEVINTAVEEVAKNPEKTTFTYNTRVVKFGSLNMDELRKMDENSGRRASDFSKSQLESEEGLKAICYGIVRLALITAPADSKDKLTKIRTAVAGEKEMSNEDYTNIYNFANDLKNILPNFETKTVPIEFDITDEKSVIEKKIDDSSVKDSCYITYVYKSLINRLNGIIKSVDMDFNFVEGIEDQEKINNVKSLVVSTKKLVTVFNKDTLRFVKAVSVITRSVNNVLAKTNVDK